MKYIKKRTIVSLIFAFVLLLVFFYVLRLKAAAVYYNQGCSYFDSGRYEEAVSALRTSQGLDSTIPAVPYMIGRVYEKKQRPYQASVEYLRAIGIDPFYIDAYSALFSIYFQKEEYIRIHEVIEKYRGTLAQRQNFKELFENVSLEVVSACIDKGTDAFLAGRSVKAYTYLQEALLLKPDFPFTHYTLGFFDYQQRRREAAIAKLQKTLQLDPQFAPAYKLLGQILIEEGSYDEAVELYQKAVESRIEDSSVYNDYGIVLNRLERYEEAAGVLEKALKLDPVNPVIRYSLGSTYRDQGDFESAVKEYQKVLGLKEDFLYVHNDLGDIYQQQGRAEDAALAYAKEIDFARRSLESFPKDAAALNSLAYALAASGDLVTAKVHADEALKLAPGYVQTYFTLAKIHEESGDIEQATTALEKVKRSFKDAAFIREKIAALRLKSRV